MIGEYKINRTTRRCSVGDRPLEPGEVYYSVVMEADEDFKRIDIAADAWTGPPEETIGWWKNRVPRAEEKKREIAPPEVLVELLRSMAGQPAAAKSRFLLALLLLRKRHLKTIEPTATGSPIGAPQQDPPEEGSRDAAEATLSAKKSRETMLLMSNLDQSTMEVEVVGIGPSEAKTLQDELIDLIYRDVDELPE
ncbi:hypothetical protein RISK_003578 [Rhodopirellula islandica]|uniref:Uncharacterized protein n=1 Tax=Rhodopirellula islandica TaxID=595434 RepID=A0A0J1EG62_RHOIS|nr:hypothetical protein [Rhodopirellula islandica]KLU04524.1 hypothetical protein RISK_003578 [Rhodopirellula islandica]